MSIPAGLFGTTYTVPEVDETDWGVQVTNLLVALASGLDASVGLITGSNYTLRLVPISASIAAGGTLTPISIMHKLSGTPGAVTASAVTAIANGTVSGQFLILVGGHATNFVTIPHGANTQMNGDCTLEQWDVIAFYFDGTQNEWIECVEK